MSMVSRPGLIRPPRQISVQNFAMRTASRTMLILHDVQGCVLLGSLASAETLTNALGAGTLVKDFGGLGAIYDAARANERVGGELRALAGAAAHAKVSGQIGFDLVRARVAVSQAEEAAQIFKSAAAESALVFMRPELQRLQHAFESERAYTREYRQIAAGLREQLGSASVSKLGQLALAAEKVASRSSIGRSILSTGKLLAQPWVSKSLFVLGVGIASIKGYVEAPTNAVQWKVGYGVGAGSLSGLADAGLAAGVARGGNPAALLYDPAVKYGAKALGFGDAGDKLTIGTFFEESSKSIISLIQAYRTGDSGPMNAIHQRSMSRNGHMVLQGYSIIGEALSRTALVDTALTKAADWHNGVPNEFKTSASWWSALKSDADSITDAVKGAAITIGERVGGTKQ
jgi:hypothetical protein